MRVFYCLVAAFCSMANASEGSIDVVRENYVHSLLHAAGMHGEVMKNFKEDPQGAPVYLYKLGLSQILMAWEKSGEDPARKVQIEQEGCSMIRRAAEEGLIVAGVAQLSLCYSALEEELTAEKRDAAKALLLKSIKEGDKWQAYYPMTVHAFQVRCYVVDMDQRIDTQTYEQALADAYELAYQFATDEEQSRIYLEKAIGMNCKVLQQLQKRDG